MEWCVGGGVMWLGEWVFWCDVVGVKWCDVVFGWRALVRGLCNVSGEVMW